MTQSRRFGRYTVELSKPDKLLFAEAGITKADLVDYHVGHADLILTHLGGRALTLKRCPEGVAGDCFYQQHHQDHFPDWLAPVSLPARDGSIAHIVVRRAADLAYLVNQGAIEFHAWLSRVGRPDGADLMIFDLDPPDGDFAPVRRAALALRDLFGRIGVACYVKLTGSRGLHVVLPLDGKADFDDMRALARRIADRLAAEHPDSLTVEQRKAKRGGRLYLDVMRNAYGQTAVAPYSPRAVPEASVAAPLTWAEVEEGRVGPRDITVGTLGRWLDRRGDPWSGMRRHARSLDGLVRAFASRRKG
ncbi:MAG: non-homologous end-joining DNA ligase [Azospirillaceae bacterium]